jgi:hypothetical protein
MCGKDRARKAERRRSGKVNAEVGNVKMRGQDELTEREEDERSEDSVWMTVWQKNRRMEGHM